jgi:hypothetical protein
MNISCKAYIIVICCITFALAQAPDTLWTRYFGSTSEDRGFCARQTSDGGYIITGVTCEYDATGDVYLIKTDANGDTV